MNIIISLIILSLLRGTGGTPTITVLLNYCTSLSLLLSSRRPRPRRPLTRHSLVQVHDVGGGSLLLDGHNGVPQSRHHLFHLRWVQWGLGERGEMEGVRRERNTSSRGPGRANSPPRHTFLLLMCGRGGSLAVEYILLTQSDGRLAG